jgi:hypothetical protein
MTKSVLRIARDALAAGEAALPPYASRYSRRDYTQPQLFALLVLRQFLKADYRGVVALAAEWRELREALRLAKVPHYSTLGCLVPDFDGALHSHEWREALWARFTMGAPQRRRRSVERYSIVKRA